ncbi:MAG: N-acetylmuramoyl-L-alanine amidase [Chitinophagales bacterium]|nr:N-acetylmuramoyl-L-alanine amidase [Chitinophagales bacterium]
MRVNAGNAFTIKTVVIDAGHGGKDPGAIGPGKTYEKDVALAVALKLGENIKKNHPGVNVIYTRKTDVFLELHERATIANKNKADLFIAVHINSSTNPQVYGSSCYVLGLHKTEANLDVAKRENAVILLEDDREKHYDFDPNTPEGHIIMSMKQNAFLEQSISIASKVENHMENHAKRKSLGVKQAGFYVLYKTAMPSILAEIGFISNPEEEKFLKSEAGHDKIAAALARAFTEYKLEMEQSEGEQFVYEETKNEEPAPKEPAKEEVKKEEPKKEEQKPVVKDEPKPEIKVEPKAETKTEVKPEPKVEPKKQPEPEVVVINDTKDDNYIVLPTGKKVRKPTESTSGGGTAPEVKPEVKEPAKKEEVPVAKTETKEPVKKQETPVVKTETKEPVKKEEPAVAKKEEVKPAATGNVVFKIQLFALKSELKERDKLIGLFKEISTEELPNGLTRYYGGKVSTYAQAQNLLDKAKANGYTTAFIVGFKNGQRMNADEMKEYMPQ